MTTLSVLYIGVGNIADSDFREIVPAGSDALKIGVYEFTSSDITVVTGCHFQASIPTKSGCTLGYSPISEKGNMTQQMADSAGSDVRKIGVSEFCNSDLPTTSRQCCQKVDADKTSTQFFVAVGDSFP
jgi:hypothetical protein